MPNGKKKASTISPERRAEAARLFDLGQQALRDKRYDTAQSAFETANEFVPHPSAAKNAAYVAQQRQLEEEERRRLEAAKFHDQAVMAANRGDWQTASSSFDWANQLAPHPQTANNITVAQREIEAAKRLGLGPPEQVTLTPVPSTDTLAKMSDTLKKKRKQKF